MKQLISNSPLNDINQNVFVTKEKRIDVQNIVIWPKQPSNKGGTKRKRESLPSVLTSSKWQQIQRDKENLKIQAEEEKKMKKQKREENKLMKEELKKTKVNKVKKKKEIKRRNYRSTEFSESSDEN